MLKSEKRWLDYKKGLSPEKQKLSEVIESRVYELKKEGKKIDTILVRNLIRGMNGTKHLYNMIDYLIDKYRRFD